MAQLAISAAGAAIGAYFGGPVGAQIGWAAGSALGGALFPAKGPEGPRLADLKVSGSAYGTPIAYVEGHPRVAGQVIWASDKYAVTTESGGGKGGPSVQTTSTIYKVDALLLLSSNEITGVRRIWSNGGLVWTAADDATADSLQASAATTSWDALTIYGGDAAQLPDPIYEAAVGSGSAPAYRGRGTVMIEGMNLGPSGILPNLTFELATGSVSEANSGILSAPLTIDGEDTISPLATLATSTPGASSITFGSGGATITNTTGDGPYLRWTNGTKLTFSDSIYAGKQITIRANVSVASTTGSGTGNNAVFLSAVGGTCYAQWGFRIVSGVVHHYTVYRIDPAAAIASDMGTALGTEYAIVLDPDGVTTHWYCDGVLMDSHGGIGAANMGGATTLYATLGAAPSPSVRSIVVSDFVVFTDELFSTTTYGNEEPTLDDVVERLCVRAGLTTGQLDVTALSGLSVRSMAVGQVTSTRGILETLAAAYRFEAVESLGQLKFVLRGGASAATLAYANMGASRGEPVEPLPLTMLNDVETPAQVTVRYVNVSNDYQDGAESSDRLLGPGIGVRVADVPIGLTPQEARTLADIHVMDVAASQRTWGPVALSNDYAHIEPTDVITLTDTDGSTYRGRVLRMRSGGGVYVLEGLIEDASILTSTLLTTTTGYDDSTVVAGAVETVLELLDIPLLRDEDDGPGFYAAFKGAASPWPGCTLFGSADDVTYTQIVTVTDATQIGECTTTLGDWIGGAVFDETNSVTVDVGEQTLVSWSRDDILSGSATGYVVGDELIYAMTATLQSAGIYKLTGLLRGQRGTEWAIPGHGSGERFVALPASGRGLRRVVLSSTDIGVARYYKAVTAGRALSTATAQTLACAGVSQAPFAPVDLRATREDNHDITLTWKRRTRRATRFTGTGGISVPLGETIESYTLDILTTTGGSALRQIEAAEQACTYTATQQTEDWALLPTSLSVVVRQLSSAVGVGYEYAAEVAVPDLAGSVGVPVWGTRPVMEIGGSLYAAADYLALSSADDGETYSTESDDGVTRQVYTYGTGYFDAQLGSQRLSIGLNITANFGGMIVGSDVLSAATVESRNTIAQDWFTSGYPRSSGSVIATGALYSDGTYYYIVGRLANQSQTAGEMYLYRANSSLAFTLRGQMTQDPADPNELPSTGFGAFLSYWFTPNSTAASIYNTDSVLTKVSGRWFLSSAAAIYYTDDADGLIDWLRCPTGLGEELTNPPTSLAGLISVGSTLLVGRDVGSGNCLSVSTDGGETWSASRPLPQYADAVQMVSFGSTAFMYYRHNGLQRVASSTAPFTSWTLADVDGVAPGHLLSNLLAISTNIVATSDFALLYSSDGVTFSPASIS